MRASILKVVTNPGGTNNKYVSCYLVWLTWCTVTFTPDSETTRDPTEEYFSDRGIQIDLEPYHDLDLPIMSDTDQCSPPGT